MLRIKIGGARLTAKVACDKGKMKNGSSELTEKGIKVIIQAINGKEPKQIAQDLGMSKSGVFAIMQREGIMTKSQVISLIEAGKNNEVIHTEGKWTIDAIEDTRKELIEKQERRKAARKASDRKRKEKMKEERRPGIEAKQAIKRKREQDFREALALGLSTEKITIQFGFKDTRTVYVKKSKEGLLGRGEITALLPDKSDEEIAAIAGIIDVTIIAKIREEIQNEVSQQEEKQKPESVLQMEKVAIKVVKPIIPKQDEETFLSLAQSLTSSKKIAEQLGMTEEQIRNVLYDYNIFTREEVVEWLDSKSDMQIAIMGNLDYTIVANVRKQEKARQIENGIEQKPIVPEVQKKKEEEMFFRMARNYEPAEKMESVFQMNPYRIILKLRKLGLHSRAEVERMIEKGETLDFQIAGKDGNANAISRIRRKVQKREILIRSISREKQEKISGKVLVETAASSIAYDTRVNSAVVIAIQEKWKRDKDLQISEKTRMVNLTKDWISLESRIRTLTKTSSENQKNSVQYMIEKILVEYETLLTQSHYAYMIWLMLT